MNSNPCASVPSTIFDDLTFNIRTFAEHPKCVGKWQQGEAGCLLTAFWKAFGFHLVPSQFENGVGTDFYVYRDDKFVGIISYLIEETNTLAFKLLPYEILDHTKRHFDHTIVTLYDDHQSVMALNLMWELIQRLPYRTSLGKKEDVIMPVCAV